MSTQTDSDHGIDPGLLLDPETEEGRVERRLDRIETEVRRLGESTRRTTAAYGIFAALALLIAGANLVAVAAKLGNTDSTKTITVAAPAATGAAAAPTAVHAARATL